MLPSTLIKTIGCSTSLSHIELIGEHYAYVTMNGVTGIGIEISLMDAESIGFDAQYNAIQLLLADLPSDIQLRIYLTCEYKTTSGEEKVSRAKPFQELGYLERRVFLFLETQSEVGSYLFEITRRVLNRASTYRTSASKILNIIDRDLVEHLQARVISKKELESLDLKRTLEVQVNRSNVDYGSHLTGAVRLFRPLNSTIELSTVMNAIASIQPPFCIVVNVQRETKTRSDLRMRSMISRFNAGKTSIDSTRMSEAESVHSSLVLSGKSLFSLEWLIVLHSETEDYLRKKIDSVKSGLSPLGDFMIETVGLYPTMMALGLGRRAHHQFYETEKSLPVYLPLYICGSPVYADLSNFEPDTLLMHRSDYSLYRYQQFDEHYLAYNSLVTGKTGSGKSVLINQISRALLRNPKIRMIKVDVGGSYSKECEQYGGQEYTFSLEEPTGLNPLRFLESLADNKESIEILATFIGALIREENEQFISRHLRAQVEEIVSDFSTKVSSGDLSPTFDDLVGFIDAAGNFPRVSILKRWSSTGVFSNAFKENSKDQYKNHEIGYRYYNFHNLLAASSEYSEGIMAAVIASINLEIIKIANKESGSSSSRLVLICDETKFFLKKHIEFFLLTTANFRKFGHAVILISQNIQDFVFVNSAGKDDLSLILNSPIRFFLPADSDRSLLQNLFNLSREQIQLLCENSYRGKKYREFVVQDDLGTRVVRLYLTKREYWEVTSTKQDQDLLNGLRSTLPGLTLNQAIECLLVNDGTYDSKNSSSITH